jgi:hypothetical protein
MTLSRFLRDYLYIPPGGKRRIPWDDEQEPPWFRPDGQRLRDVFFREVVSDFSSAPGAYFRRVDRLEITDMLDTRPVQIKCVWFSSVSTSS